MLALDLGVFHRRNKVIGVAEAAIWSGFWIALALGFAVLVGLRWGSEAAEAFLTGYVIEKALSVDNLFVFFVIFAAFGVPAAYQHRLLFWGIIGAIILRAAMILTGTALLTRFQWLVYVFGAVLIATGLRMLTRPRGEPHPERSGIFRALQQLIPTTPEVHGAKMFVRTNGRLLATPLFVVLVLIELSDVVVAVDSILAIFAITRDPFIVFTSNIFAILGLRSLYFVLAVAARRFSYLQPGLALVLTFVGAKMAASPVLHVPVLASLAAIILLLGGSVLASIMKTRHAHRQRT
jgi:tellurite resistance protein TerC